MFFHRSSFYRCPTTLIIPKFQYLRTGKHLTNILYTNSSELRVHMGTHIFTPMPKPVALNVVSNH